MSSPSKIKDLAIEKTLILLLRPKLRRYGDLRSVSLDTTSKILTAEIRLFGDPIPLEVTSVRYRLEDAGPSVNIVFYEFKVSKEWLQNLVEDHFPEVRYPVPDFIKPLIE